MEGGALIGNADAQALLEEAAGLVVLPPPVRERLQWIAQLRSGRVVHQYGDDGKQARFADLPAGEVATVWLQAEMPMAGGAVPFVTILAAILHVPEGAEAQLLYRGSVDVTMSGDGAVTQQGGPRQLLAGWRIHDGSRRECWVLVEPDATAHVGLDPQRPWPG